MVPQIQSVLGGEFPIDSEKSSHDSDCRIEIREGSGFLDQRTGGTNWTLRLDPKRRLFKCGRNPSWHESGNVSQYPDSFKSPFFALETADNGGKNLSRFGRECTICGGRLYKNTRP